MQWKISYDQIKPVERKLYLSKPFKLSYDQIKQNITSTKDRNIDIHPPIIPGLQAQSISLAFARDVLGAGFHQVTQKGKKFSSSISKLMTPDDILQAYVDLRNGVDYIELGVKPIGSDLGLEMKLVDEKKEYKLSKENLCFNYEIKKSDVEEFAQSLKPKYLESDRTLEIDFGNLNNLIPWFILSKRSDLIYQFSVKAGVIIPDEDVVKEQAEKESKRMIYSADEFQLKEHLFYMKPKDKVFCIMSGPKDRLNGHYKLFLTDINFHHLATMSLKLSNANKVKPDVADYMNALIADYKKRIKKD